MPSPFLGLLGVVVSLTGLVVVAFCSVNSRLEAPPGPARTPRDFTPVFLVTAAAVALLYAFLFNQSWTTYGVYAKLCKEAKSRGEKPPGYAGLKYGGGNSAVLAADRAAGNYMEQLVPFLLSLYGHAVFVSSSRAAAFGWAWIFFRSYYGFTFVKRMALISTLPAYACLWWMLGTAVHAAVTASP